MKDIVKRLRDINEDSLIMGIVRDCLDAAEEIVRLREENDSKQKALLAIKNVLVHEQKGSVAQKAAMPPARKVKGK